METTKKYVHIKAEKPPEWIWQRAHAMFEIDDQQTLYTYDGAIYFPNGEGKTIAQSVIAHESTHMKQQEEVGADIWWSRYFDEPEFRRAQELEAYGNQYKHFCMLEKDRNRRARYLDIIATFASSPMYKMNLSKSEALKLIRNGQ